MSLALITVGTSYREALCWDFDDNFEDPLFGKKDISPVHPKVRKLRFEIGQQTKDNYDLHFFNKAFRKIETPEQTWRYPAEIDTLVQFSYLKDQEFNGINKIQFIISGDEDGRFAADVLQNICEHLWPDKYIFDEYVEYEPIDAMNQLDAELIQKITKKLDSTQEPVFLFVTGGYKFVVIMAGIAFQKSEAAKKYLIYKHEEGALIIHPEQIKNSEILYIGV